MSKSHSSPPKSLKLAVGYVQERLHLLISTRVGETCANFWQTWLPACSSRSALGVQLSLAGSECRSANTRTAGREAPSDLSWRTTVQTVPARRPCWDAATQPPNPSLAHLCHTAQIGYTRQTADVTLPELLLPVWELLEKNWWGVVASNRLTSLKFYECGSLSGTIWSCCLSYNAICIVQYYPIRN